MRFRGVSKEFKYDSDGKLSCVRYKLSFAFDSSYTTSFLEVQIHTTADATGRFRDIYVEFSNTAISDGDFDEVIDYVRKFMNEIREVISKSS